MSRESKAQAIASGLQPKGLDLTKFAPPKRGNTYGYRKDVKLSEQDAAGALAFASLDVEREGEVQRGDPLPGLLLRLKYAKQLNRALFSQAHEIVNKRYGGLRTYHAETMRAVSASALLEWVSDACPVCRERRGRKHRGGMRCIACRNSGRLAFDPKRRHRLVNEYLLAAGKRGAAVNTLNLKNFGSHWMQPYLRILDALRMIDRARLVVGVDLGMKAGFRAEEAPEKEEA